MSVYAAILRMSSESAFGLSRTQSLLVVGPKSGQSRISPSRRMVLNVMS